MQRSSSLYRNMQILCLLLAALLFSFAWLSPFHTYPWVTFSSELASFGASLVLLAIFFNKNIKNFFIALVNRYKKITFYIKIMHQLYLLLYGCEGAYGQKNICL